MNEEAFRSEEERQAAQEWGEAPSGEKQQWLEELGRSSEFDKALYPVLERLFSLPLRTTDSCSGHILQQESGEVLDTSIAPYLSIIEDETSVAEEIEVQQRFRAEIETLNEILGDLVGQGLVDAKISGYLEELPTEDASEYPFKQLSIEETIEKGYPYTLTFHISEEAQSKLEAAFVLEKTWQGFFKYLEAFDNKNLPLPQLPAEFFIKK